MEGGARTAARTDAELAGRHQEATGPQRSLVRHEDDARGHRTGRSAPFARGGAPALPERRRRSGGRRRHRRRACAWDVTTTRPRRKRTVRSRKDKHGQKLDGGGENGVALAAEREDGERGVLGDAEGQPAVKDEARAVSRERDRTQPIGRETVT